VVELNSPAQVRVTGDEIYPIFHKRTDNYNRLKRRWRHWHLMIVDLEIMSFFDYNYAIFKHGKPKNN